MTPSTPLEVLFDAMVRRDVDALRLGCQKVDLTRWHEGQHDAGHVHGNPALWFMQDFQHAPELLPVLLDAGASLFGVAPQSERDHWAKRMGGSWGKDHDLPLTPYLLSCFSGRLNQATRDCFLDIRGLPGDFVPWSALVETAVFAGDIVMLDLLVSHPLPAFARQSWTTFEIRLQAHRARLAQSAEWASWPVEDARLLQSLDSLWERARLSLLPASKEQPVMPTPRL
jgi:hypothetical protein